MRPRLKFLEKDLIERIVSEAMDLLATVGLLVQNENAVALLADHGGHALGHPDAEIDDVSGGDFLADPGGDDPPWSRLQRWEGGSDPVTGSWTRHADDIYRIEIDGPIDLPAYGVITLRVEGA